MTNQQKLNEAVKLLREVSASWDEDKVINYPCYMPDFQGLVEDIANIEVSN